MSLLKSIRSEIMISICEALSEDERKKYEDHIQGLRTGKTYQHISDRFYSGRSKNPEIDRSLIDHAKDRIREAKTNLGAAEVRSNLNDRFSIWNKLKDNYAQNMKDQDSKYSKLSAQNASNKMANFKQNKYNKP